MFKFGVASLSVFVLFSVSGCSGTGLSEQAVQTGEVGLQEAIKFVDAGQCTQALPILDKCIAAGGLNADLLSTALVQRARCHVDAGNTEAADKDLQNAEQGSPPLDQFHLVRGLLYKKLGKTKQATEEFAKAKKVSPKIKIPS